MIPIASSRHRYNSPEIKISKFAGVDYSTDPTQINDNRAADMINMQLDTKGVLQRFPGYKRAFPLKINSISWSTAVWETDAWEGEGSLDTPINHLSFNPAANKFVISHNGILYVFSENTAPINLYSPVAQKRTISFFFNDKQYFLDGTYFTQWDGVNIPTPVENSGYIPTTTIAKPPTGGGTVYEPVNLLQPLRKNSFIGNGSATVFQLDTVNLDANLLTAVVNGVSKVETTDFTVNRITGQVTFIVAPSNGAGVDNIIIQFGKTIAGYANLIKNCTDFAIFGSGNNLRVFLTGNINYKNRDWMSGLNNPSYFPDTGYTDIGSSAVSIKKYSNQQGVLQIIKADNFAEPTIWIRSFSLVNGVATFPITQSNASIGCLSADSVQVIDDSTVFLSRKGVFRAVTTYISGERELQHISDNIEPNILDELNLENAVSFDFSGGRYGIAINDKVYVMDYRNKYVDIDGIVKYEAYVWDNIPACCFFEKDGYLYFGSNSSGMVYKILHIKDLGSYYYDGEAYESFWKSKIMAMSKENYKKLVDTIGFTLDPSTTRSSADMYYITDKKISKLIKKIRTVRLNFNDINFNDFSFNISTLPKTGKKQINKDLIYLQIILKNPRGGEGMTITSVTSKFSFAGEV